MLDNCKYALLMNSLPRHPLQLSVAKQTPLSKIQLDLRLQLLAAEDVEALKNYKKNLMNLN